LTDWKAATTKIRKFYLAAHGFRTCEVNSPATRTPRILLAPVEAQTRFWTCIIGAITPATLQNYAAAGNGLGMIASGIRDVNVEGLAHDRVL
jgi:hypothetical protein